MAKLELTGNEKQEEQLQQDWQLFRQQVFVTPIADAGTTRSATTCKEAVNLSTGKKIIRYVAAFILCAIGIVAIGIVLEGHFPTFGECFLVQSLGFILFYYGQKLGWLTYDPGIEMLSNRRREARIKARVATIQRTRAEREAAEGRYYRR